MDELKQYVLDPINFVNKTTLIFGDSEDGKTTLLRDICKCIKDEINQAFVFNGSETENPTYSKGFVPVAAIRTTVKTETIKLLTSRQCKLVAIYNRAQNIDVLRSLFKRVATEDELRALDSVGIDAAADADGVAGAASDDVDDLEKKEERVAEFKCVAYKTFINRNYERLMRDKDRLTPDQVFSLEHLYFNPNLLLIFDDVTEEVVSVSKHPDIKQLFYKGRHMKTTVIICLHTDKKLDTDIRKGAFNRFYMSESIAYACMKHDMVNGMMTKELFDKAAGFIKIAFDPGVQFQKLLWVRKDRAFYKYKATKHKPFSMGSPSFWKYCELVGKSSIL